MRRRRAKTANPREIAPEKFELLKADIQKYPQFLQYNALKVYPLEDGKYIVIGGNMRCRALKELGFKEVPCVVIPKETHVEELKAYIILDNSSFGRWDWPKLTSDEWDSAQLQDWGVDMPTEALDGNCAGMALVMKGTHLCKSMRGVKNQGKMTVAYVSGVFERPEVKQEFYQLIKLQG